MWVPSVLRAGAAPGVPLFRTLVPEPLDLSLALGSFQPSGDGTDASDFSGFFDFNDDGRSPNTNRGGASTE